MVNKDEYIDYSRKGMFRVTWPL